MPNCTCPADIPCRCAPAEPFNDGGMVAGPGLAINTSGKPEKINPPPHTYEPQPVEPAPLGKPTNPQPLGETSDFASWRQRAEQLDSRRHEND